MDLSYFTDNKSVSPQHYILDPLSTIIKLALLNHKSDGTKLQIHENIILFQEPGMFQGVSRFFTNSSRSDLSYLYNPIQIACTKYLSPEDTDTHSKMKELFVNAQKGINKLTDTYKYCNILKQSLYLFSVLIDNILLEKNNAQLFKSDNITCLYTPELMAKFDTIWTPEKINIMLGLTDFMNNDFNVTSVETIMKQIDCAIHTQIYAT